MEQIKELERESEYALEVMRMMIKMCREWLDDRVEAFVDFSEILAFHTHYIREFHEKKIERLCYELEGRLYPEVDAIVYEVLLHYELANEQMHLLHVKWSKGQVLGVIEKVEIINRAILYVQALEKALYRELHTLYPLAHYKLHMNEYEMVCESIGTLDSQLETPYSK